MEKIDSLLIKGGTIVDPTARKHKTADIVVRGNIIDKIGAIDAEHFNGTIIDAVGNWIVPGLIDMHVHFREPGREDEETVRSGCAASMAGGFTAACPMPNTEPVCDKQEVVEFLLNKAKSELVDVLPIAAVTKKRAGKEITEIAELVRAGAVAFSDDGMPVRNSAVMRAALEYSSMYGTTIIDHCEDMELFKGGHMNESFMSTKLGLPPIPSVGEDILIARDILLAHYTGGKVHIAHMSTRGGVELVRKAKNEGVQVTCEVTPHHLVLTDEELAGYDTNLKMNPPLRTREDVEALRNGLKEGTIDAIASDHAPHAIEEKEVEFAAAPFGILGLETMLGIIMTKIVSKGVITMEEAIEKMSIAPRNILNLAVPKIARGQAANLTIINPDKEWTVHVNKFKSLSRNAPYDGWKLKGWVTAVINKGFFHLNGVN